MEGEEEILKGTAIKYFELFPERQYKQGECDGSRPMCRSIDAACIGSAAEVHFRLAESQFYRLLSGYAT